MSPNTVPPPPGLGTESEFPFREFPDLPLWTENYCYVCYDPTTEIGVWTHLGRAPFDPTLWRELSMIFLPSGERLVNKGYGRSETERGPGGATLSYECIEPWNQWRSRRDGAAIRTTAKELDAGMLGDRAHERVAFDLTWQGHSLIWDWGEVEDAHKWGKLHYEQLCQVRGTVTVGGETIPFDGSGLRDHTSGPRDFTVVVNHIWCWGNFPSGRGFIILHVVVDGQALTRAITLEDGELVAQTLGNPPVLASRSQGSDPFVLELGEHRIAGEILHLLPNGFDGPNDICLGYDPAVTGTANFECFSRFEWDGEIGYGLTERSVRGR
ncbi:MAG: hypothetical protein ACRD0C_04020 [Acidimicrobiia bacterium]